jgi:hypothetical protein
MTGKVIDLGAFRAIRSLRRELLPEEVRERRRQTALRGWETRRRNEERCRAALLGNGPRHAEPSPHDRAVEMARKLTPETLEAWLYCGELFLQSQRLE